MELGKGGAVLVWEEGFFVGDVRGREPENSVGGAGRDGGFHKLCVELLSGLLGIPNCSVFAEAQDFVAELLLERFLHIPRTWVCSDRGI